MSKIAILSLFTIFLFGQSSKQDEMLRSKFGQTDFDDINHISNRVNNSKKSFNSPPKLFKSSFANNAPTFISSSSDSVNLFNGSVPYNFNVLTNDPDGDDLTVSVASNPSWLSLNSVSGGNVSDVTKAYKFTGNRTSGTDYLGTTHDIKLAGSIFVSLNNHTIVKVDTGDGTSAVIAGIPGESGSSGDGGAATSAKLNNPYGLDIDDDGNIYIADTGNNKIRKIDTNGIITTIAGTGNNSFSGDGAAATSSNLSSPYDIALDGNGNLYIADSNNSRIRMIGTNGNISTIVGTGESGFDGNGGAAASAKINFPNSIDFDSDGRLYIAEANNNVVRRVDVNSDRTISIFAGTGSAGYNGDGGAATSAELNSPWGVNVKGDKVYIGEAGNHIIRLVAADGGISTLAGTGKAGSSGDGGVATSALLNVPENVTFSSTTQDIYIADLSNQRIRQIKPDGTITTLAGRSPNYQSNILANNAEIMNPRNIWIDNNDHIYVPDQGLNRLLKIDKSGIITTIAGTGEGGFSGDGGPAVLAQIDGPRGVTGDNVGNLYLSEGNGNRIRKIDIYGNISTYAGTGSAGYSGDGGAATSAEIEFPYVLKYYNDALYFADLQNSRVRKIDSNGVITTVAGNGDGSISGDGGAATSAGIPCPATLDFDSEGNMYIGDYCDHVIRKVGTDGNISNFAGTGTNGYNGDGGAATSAQISYPINLTVDKADNVIFVHWTTTSPVIRKIWKGTNIITTIVGTGTSGYSTNKKATEALISVPQGLAFDSKGNLYFGDQGNNLISKVDASYHTLSGTPTLSDVATETMTLTASDGNGGSVTQTFTLKVQNRSDYLSFDGIDDYATIPDSYNALEGLTDDSFTVSLWAKPIGLREVNDGQIFARQGYHIGVGYTADRKFRFGAWDSDNVYYPITTTQSYFNTWHHLAMNYQKSTKTANFYVDGSLVGEAVLNKDLLAYDSDYFFGSVHLSNDYNFKYPYSGGLDQISFWNSALSSDQISKIYSGTRDGDILTFATDNSVLTNLTAYYPVNNDDNSATLVDYSGNGFNGSINGALMSAAAKAIEHSVTLTTPNGGEFINQNDYYRINWSTTGYGIKHTNLQISYDGGTTYNSINSTNTTNLDSTANDLTYFGRLVEMTSRDAKLKVTIVDTSGNFISDFSDNLFNAFSVDIYKAETNNIEMPIRNDGVSGDHVHNNGIGPLLYPDETLSTHLYLSKFVWTGVRSDNSQIIGTAKPYTRHEYHPIDSLSVSDKGIYTEIKGKFQAVSDSIIVEQKTLIPNGFSADSGDYIIMEYIVENRTGVDFGETYLGSFFDIDINDYTQNLTGWLKNSAENKNIAYVYDNNSQIGDRWESVIGVHSINNDMYMSRNKSADDANTTTEFMELMKNKTENQPSSSDENADYRMIMSKKLSSFNNGQKDTLLFAILAANSAEDLQATNANWLNNNIDLYGLPPVINISDLTIKEDQEFSFTPDITDDTHNDNIGWNPKSSDTSLVDVEFSDGDLKIIPKQDMHGSTTISVFATDGFNVSNVSFNLTVEPVQDPPSGFDWITTASDSIFISQSNLASTYDLEWTLSNDVDGDSIHYVLFAQVGVYEQEEIWDTTSTKVQISYSEILEGVFEGQPINAATVRFVVKSTDGIDTVDVTGEDRVLYVNRYDYLSTLNEGVPEKFALHENYPNPFNPSTTLRFDLPEVRDLTITIYNMIGQKVKTFNMQSTPAGYHAVKWNATNDYGDPVGAGVYLYQLHTKDFVKTRKMVLLK
ncbi:MAG: LamG-like jellyroll fold domain-containing protein [Candidatus Neomarinimicrobiota bacterium]